MSALARDAFDQHDWTEAHRLLSTTDPAALAAADLERLAVAAYLVGDDDASRIAWDDAHDRYREDGSPADAARCTVWLAITLLLRGETAHGGGWLARTQRLIDDEELDCTAGGYLLVPAFLQALGEGEATAARELSAAMRAIGQRFADPDLVALGTLGEGQAAILAGEVDHGIALLDETMVSLQADDVGPIVTGIAYCAVIESCMAVHDIARATEWTDVLSAWCDAQPGLVPFRGQCAVHRSQILCHRGDWPRALVEALAAEVLLGDPPHPALGLAHYQEAELHRLRGQYDPAETSYRDANQHGYLPQPGLALLHLARGHVAEAGAMISGALDGPDPATRPVALAAAVEIHRTSGDTAAARVAAAELATIATGHDAPLLDALAHHAEGAVLLAEGSPSDALVALRSASHAFGELGLPYDVGRTRMLIGLAHAALGDRVSADLELDAARATFDQLGAVPDVERIDALRGADDVRDEGPLTGREREVLRAVAGGRSNREIATDLTISEHTVARHVQNIFSKIDVRSRAAATAYAYEHDLV